MLKLPNTLPLFGSMKILHTLIGMGSAALAAAVPYPGKAVPFPTRDKEVLKFKKYKQIFWKLKLQPHIDSQHLPLVAQTKSYQRWFSEPTTSMNRPHPKCSEVTLYSWQDVKLQLLTDWLTTSTAPYSRSAATRCWESRNWHLSCTNSKAFSPSDVQSATIQPQSRVLNGKPSWSEQTSTDKFMWHTCSQDRI